MQNKSIPNGNAWDLEIQFFLGVVQEVNSAEDSSPVHEFVNKRNFRTPLLKAGDSTLIGVARTAEGAIQTDLEGKQLNNSRVDA